MEVTSYLLGKKSGGGAPNLQEKSVTIASNGIAHVIADTGYDGLSEVVATVNVPTEVDDYFTTEVTSQNKNDFKGVFLKNMPPLTIDSNVKDTINLFNAWPFSSINLSSFDTSNIESMYSMFANSKITSLDLSSFNTEKVFNMGNMFSGILLTSIDLSSFKTPALTNVLGLFSYSQSLQTVTLGNNFDTSKVTATANMFNFCQALKTVNGHLDLSAATNFNNMFGTCDLLEDLPTFSNIGKAFDTSSAAHNINYKLTFSGNNKLTHTSLMNIINGLYDIASAGVATQDLVLGSTNLAKLSQAEIDIATGKGWTVS